MFLKKLGLWLMLSLILLMVSVIVFAGQSFGDIEITRKNLGDINADGTKEVAQETTSWGVSSCSIGVKIFSGKKTIFKLPTFSGDTADGYKVVGKKIVVWRGNWQLVQSKWEPHYYNFTWYGWDAKKKIYVIVQEGLTTNTYNYKTAERSMSFLAQNPGNKVVTSKTIEGSVQLYCIRTRYPDWPKSTSMTRFKEKLVRSEWASISAYVIEDNVKIIGKYYFFIVHRSTIGWSVVWLSDKKDIHPDSARSAGIPQKVIQELGWIFDNPSP